MGLVKPALHCAARTTAAYDGHFCLQTRISVMPKKAKVRGLREWWLDAVGLFSSFLQFP